MQTEIEFRLPVGVAVAAGAMQRDGV
ncbi:MAG: hypothetical protein QOJ85_4273, partial [Solirubrobacteraceae bacterium]|nr:hypothetical protein [Solirubrobacteraceae bacterium]